MSEPLRINIDEGVGSEDVRISSKMSKSKPASGILIHDDEKTIRNKISKAFCPVELIVGNPILELVRYVVFHEFDEFIIERPTKYGGSITYTSYKDIEHDFVTKKIHPMDLKISTATHINKIIEPIRKHFEGREPHLS